MAEDCLVCAALVESSCRHLFEGVTDTNELLRIAFREAHDHYMYSDEQVQFKGGIGAVLMTLKSGPEFDRIKASVKRLGQASALLNAMQAGVPVDLDKMLAEREAEPKIEEVPLRKLWDETRPIHEPR